MIVISCLFIELLAVGNVKCLGRLEIAEDSLGRVFHGQSTKHMKRCCHLTMKSCSYTPSAQCLASLQHGCVLPNTVTPSFNGSCAFLGFSHLTVDFLALESLSQKARRGEVVKGNKKRDSRVKGSKSVFSMEMSK